MSARDGIVGTQNLSDNEVVPSRDATQVVQMSMTGTPRYGSNTWLRLTRFLNTREAFAWGTPCLSGRRPMSKMTVIAATACALLGSAPLLSAMTTPSFAQGWRDSDDEMRDRGMRGAFLERLQIRRDLRDLLEDRMRSRQDTRDLLSDLLRDRLRERLADRRDRDEDSDGGLRGRLRERFADFRDSDEDNDGGLRGRLRERLAERIHGRDSGDCYIFTRSLRDQDGDFLIIVRRRICRD
jgi:hypothetical protein